MRTLLLSLLLLAPGFGAEPLKPLPPVYKPDPAKWRLELTPDLGGWTNTGSLDLRLKIVDPADPEPPKEDEVRFSDRYYEEDDEGAPQEVPEKTAEELRQLQLWEEEYQRRVAWRDRKLQVWFNGTPIQLPVRVGFTTNYTLEAQNGENRLEVLEPDSGRRVVRTWWATAEHMRFQVRQVKGPDDEWSGGSLEILEPGGNLASQGRRTPSGGTLTWSGEYFHPNPPQGTYTLRWTNGYRGGKPFRVVVEAVLDGGTDSERRWRFEHLMLPGAGPATLGTIDIEN